MEMQEQKGIIPISMQIAQTVIEGGHLTDAQQERFKKFVHADDQLKMTSVAAERHPSLETRAETMKTDYDREREDIRNDPVLNDAVETYFDKLAEATSENELS